MKLRDAWICLDCDEVFELETVHFLDQKVQMDHCPSCCSKSIKRMCVWLQTMKAEICEASLIAGKLSGWQAEEKKEGSGEFTPWNPERFEKI